MITTAIVAAPTPSTRIAIYLDGQEIGTLKEVRHCSKRWHAVLHILPSCPLQIGNIAQGFGEDAADAVNEAVKAGLSDARRYIDELQIIQAKL